LRRNILQSAQIGSEIWPNYRLFGWTWCERLGIDFKVLDARKSLMIIPRLLIWLILLNLLILLILLLLYLLLYNIHWWLLLKWLLLNLLILVQ
jgi:hypothetical protein